MLTPQESQVLEIIRANPYASQQEMADQLGMPRSTLAGIISGLVQQNLILGRAYILNDHPYIVCIGGMNVDRKYHLKGVLHVGTSNPVTSNLSVGGVARNIAENLGRLGLDVRMLSLAGQDQDFQIIRQETQDFVNLQSVTLMRDQSTSTYTAILDAEGDMQIAYADMDICEHMTQAWLEANQGQLLKAKFIVCDLNLPLEATKWLIEFCDRHQLPLAVIPVSQPKMAHLPADLHGVEWLVVNRGESYAYFDLDFDQNFGLEQLAQAWLDKGVKNIIITNGSQSFVYGNQDQIETYPVIQADKVVDATGAGDAFSAGIIYGAVQGFQHEKSLQLGLVNAYKTIQSPQTVRLDLTAKRLLQEWQQKFH